MSGARQRLTDHGLKELLGIERTDEWKTLKYGSDEQRLTSSANVAYYLRRGIGGIRCWQSGPATFAGTSPARLWRLGICYFDTDTWRVFWLTRSQQFPW